MEMRLSNIFKTKNVRKLTKVILVSSYSVLKVTSKRKTLKQPVYFLKTVEFWPAFDIQSDMTLAISWENLLSKLANIHINKGHPLRNNGSLKI